MTLRNIQAQLDLGLLLTALLCRLQLKKKKKKKRQVCIVDLMHAEAGQGEEAELQENVRTGPFLERKACVLREARETMWKKTPKPAAPGRGPEGTGEGLERLASFSPCDLASAAFAAFKKQTPGLRSQLQFTP